MLNQGPQIAELSVASITWGSSLRSILNGDWGPVGPLIKNRSGSWRYRLTLHSFRVEMRVSALAMLIPGDYLKRLKPISHPYGDVLLAKYRACARGHVLEHQRVANDGQKSRWNASLSFGKSNIATLNPKRVRGPTSGRGRRT